MGNFLYRKYIKRLLDILLALGGLIVLSPIMLLVALLVKFKLGSPVIFKQKRPGKDERIFEMYKFRSMTEERDDKGRLLPDEVRLTNFGRILRGTSLDELPELLNILKGDMSIVGPRPLLVQYLPLYDSAQKQRHNVKPGLTGLAQVSGRNEISWEEKFYLDVEYARHVTFSGDLKIFIRTVWKVLKKEGINTNGDMTMEIFKGSVNERKLK